MAFSDRPLPVIDPVTKHVEKVYTGWAPRELIQLPGSDEFLVFNAEDQFAHVKPDGRYQIHKLPFDYPHQAVHTGEGNIYLSYGPSPVLLAVGIYLGS
jgi:hypothetical protein